MYQKLSAVLGSKKFFYVIVGLLVFQAAWIALSSSYPMAFDEDFHFGIIQLYAHHLWPFWSAPIHNGTLGAVSRDPSYLYQWLMSFPYRLIKVFTHDTTIQVILLRGINIGLFASALPLFRRLLKRGKLSDSATNLTLLLFVLIPVSSLLAAQINYDNLFIIVVAATLLLTLQVDEEIVRFKRINVTRLGWLLVLCLLGSLVKYAFLPVFLAVALWLGWQAWRTLGFGRKFWRTLGFGLTLMTKRARWLLLAVLVISLAMFGERYGVNLVRYHAPFPDCSQVLSDEECSAYEPWQRDRDFAADKGDVTRNPVLYSGMWLGGMWLRLFFAVAGPANDFQTRGPLTIPAIGFLVIVVGGLVTISNKQRFKHAFQSRTVRFYILVSGLYVFFLWLDNYHAYLRTGQPVAINGRYLLPVIPLLFVPLVLAYQQGLRKRPEVGLWLAGAAIVVMVWGGGFLTYVLRSNDSWYWSNTAVHHLNHAIQKVLTPIVPGTDDPTKFLFIG